VLTVAVALVCGLASDHPRRPQPQLTFALFEQLRPGMTKAEVIAILGDPRFDPSRCVMGRRIRDWPGAPQSDEVEAGWTMDWWGEEERLIYTSRSQE
jgi:hypothetical protein